MSKPFERAMTLAFLSGLKMTLGPAFLGAANRRPGSSYWVLAAMGEMVVDKVGFVPSRASLPVLLPHTMAGAWVARESLKRDGVHEPWAAAVGAVVAAGAASLAPRVRFVLSKTLGVPDALVGLLEDYLALKLGTRAMGMSPGELKQAAVQAFEELKGRVQPTLKSVGIEV